MLYRIERVEELSKNLFVSNLSVECKKNEEKRGFGSRRFGTKSETDRNSPPLCAKFDSRSREEREPINRLGLLSGLSLSVL